MSPWPRVGTLLGVVLLLVVPVGLPLGAATPTAELTATAPNPTAPGDRGEWVEIDFPAPTNVSGWTLADGETVVRFPPRTVVGRVVATTEPGALAATPAEATVVALRGRLALANAGETIELRRPAGLVDRLTYAEAPEGMVFRVGPDGGAWRIPGATDRPVVTDTTVPATLFVLPDSPEVVAGAIAEAEDRILLAAYTFASGRVGAALCRANDRGLHVEVLLEGDPIGGMTRRQAGSLDALAACGIPIHVLGGPGDRYAYHHAKYAVVDDRALVVSENWKPAGVGGRSSRGWGTLLESPVIAGALAETFRADADYRDARPWAAVGGSIDRVEEPAANGSFPARFGPRRVTLDRVELLLTPDNAEGALVEYLDAAERSVAVQQVSIGDADGPFIGATRRAAARGVPTRVLLSGAWYVAGDNRALVESLNQHARERGIPLRARLVTPRSRFEKSHVKALIVDETAVVGSLNWNVRAARRNREVLVALHDPAAATYYGRVHAADWRGGTWRLPVGFAAVVAIAALGSAGLLARQLRFDDGEAPGVSPDEPLPVQL